MKLEINETAAPNKRPKRAKGKAKAKAGAKEEDKYEEMTKEELDAERKVLLEHHAEMVKIASKNYWVVNPVNGELPPMQTESNLELNRAKYGYVDKSGLDSVAKVEFSKITTKPYDGEVKITTTRSIKDGISITANLPIRGPLSKRIYFLPQGNTHLLSGKAVIQFVPYTIPIHVCGLNFHVKCKIPLVDSSIVETVDQQNKKNSIFAILKDVDSNGETSKERTKRDTPQKADVKSILAMFRPGGVGTGGSSGSGSNKRGSNSK